MEPELTLEEPRTNGALAVRTETASIMETIARAAENPNIDPAKLEKFMDLYERAQAREAKTAYFQALSDMQDELPVIPERGKIDIGRGNPQKYALWEDVNKLIKPVLKRHGFALSFRTGFAEAKIAVTGVLSHSSGHFEETTIHLPSDTSGSKNAVQAVGSSTSYGKRYVTAALLNLTSTGEDDNGLSGGGDEPLSDEQFNTVMELCERVNANKEAFCKYMKVPSIKDIRAKDYHRAIEALNLKLGQGRK